MFRPYARKRYPTKCDVQLRSFGTARTGGSSSAVDPGDGRCGAERTVAVVWSNVSRLGPPLDCAGNAAAGVAVATAVFDSQRAVVNGAARIQLVVPLVCGAEHDEAVWVPTVFSKNRDPLLEGEIAAKFFAQVLDQARANDLLSDEHFSVDGTLIEAWASQKSFPRKDAASRNLQSRMGVHLRGGGLQSGADEEPGDGSLRINRGRSVPERQETGDSDTYPPRKCP